MKQTNEDWNEELKKLQKEYNFYNKKLNVVIQTSHTIEDKIALEKLNKLKKDKKIILW